MADNYTTVDAVIIDTCHKIGDMELRKYGQLHAHSLSWFTTDYNAESGQTLKTVLLDVGPDRVANLPDDYLDYVVVGRQVGQYIRTLAHNPKLSPLPVLADDVARFSVCMIPQAWWPTYNYVGYDGGSVCGYGWGEYREEFTIDARERTLRLSSLLGTDEPLYFQYVSSDLNPGKAMPLHPAYGLCLSYWMLWQWYLMKNEQGPARSFETLYYRFRTKARLQLSPFSMAELQRIIHSAFGQIR